VFAPLRVKVPLPCFTTAPALVPFSITPANVVSESSTPAETVSSPDVSVPPSNVIFVVDADDDTAPTVSL
jgi:hypothetical protein